MIFTSRKKIKQLEKRVEDLEYVIAMMHEKQAQLNTEMVRYCHLSSGALHMIKRELGIDDEVPQQKDLH